MITVKEIAKLCNVSISTVSNILNGKQKVSEETRQKVLQVVKETGYQPNYYAQGMRKQNTNIIGIIIEDLSEFTAPIVEAAMAYCEMLNYKTILINLRLYYRWQDTWYQDDNKLQSVLKPAILELESFKVDGIIYVAGHCRVVHCFPEDFKLPAVVAYGLSKSEKYPSVVIDDEKAAYDLTNYLVSKGHQRIGVIAGDSDNLHTKKRCIGYQRALYEKHILYNPEWIQYGNWQKESGYQCAKKLMQENVTAIFCMNEYMADGVYDYLYEQGLTIGKDVAVAGFDDIIARFFRPQLTTTAIQLFEIGKKAADIMLKLLDKQQSDEKIPAVTKIPCRLVLRDSV